MDTLTHGAVGVLLTRAVTGESRRGELTESQKGMIAACAAMFPDLDYLTFWLDPYAFITQWHRGISHSLVMLPVWAILLGTAFSWLLVKGVHWRQCVFLSALGLLSHILLDVCTVYGTQIFAPLNDDRASFALSFDINPWFAVIAAAALAASLYRRRWSRWGILALCVFLVVQSYFKSTAYTIVNDQARMIGVINRSLQAIPQPFAPWYWKLVIEHADNYLIAHLSLLDADPVKGIAEFFGGETLQAYQPIDELQWDSLAKWGAADQRALVVEIWQKPKFEAFRGFSSLPWLYRVDVDAESTCVWFSDLRYTMPSILPSFRYGMCGTESASHWNLYRLSRGSFNQRQRLPD